MNTKDVIVNGKHVLLSRVGTGLDCGTDLGVINTGEVASTSGLVIFGLESEGVGVNTGVRVTGVVDRGLYLVEILTVLFLEAILTIQDYLEAGKRPARHVLRHSFLLLGVVDLQCPWLTRRLGDNQLHQVVVQRTLLKSPY